MKILMTAATLAALLLSPLAHAADTAASDVGKAMRQHAMKDCNDKAGEAKGDERRAMMKECLSNKKDKKEAQQNRMKTCNADAKGKTGDERKAFMKECLSNKG